MDSFVSSFNPTLKQKRKFACDQTREVKCEG